VQDHAEAARLYRLAAEQGHAEARVNLGMMFEKGLGVVQDHAEAARLYRLAAEQGHPESELRLNLMKVYYGQPCLSRFEYHEKIGVDIVELYDSDLSVSVDAKAPHGRTSPDDPRSTIAIQRAVKVYNTPVNSNKSTKYLLALGIPQSSPLAWIADHLARPPLPPDWEKLKDDKRRTYYGNVSLLQSCWEHPLLFYYPWLCRIFSDLLPIDSSTGLPIAPHELIDFLTDGSSLLKELCLEAECLPMHDLKSLQRRVSCEAIFYYTWLFTPRQGESRHAYLRLSDERPWDPELVRSVTEYYGIDLAVEPHLIWVPKLALVAPLPHFWTSSEDADGDTLFYCIVSSYCTQSHPVDRYITLLLQQLG
jgi:hypothetical protein